VNRDRTWLVLAAFVAWLSPLTAQRLLDRVIARVDGSAITLTDMHAAIAVGAIAVPDGPDREAAAVERMIDRQLMLAEVARFTTREPDPQALEREVAAMTERVGPRLAAVMESTGLDEGRMRAIARDTLRIQAYLDQRFGATVPVSAAEVEQYYRIHPEEFMRGGTPMSFDEAEPIARERAAAARRAATVAQWLRDLRARAEVIVPKTVGR
jgi:hypothetical protein